MKTRISLKEAARFHGHLGPYLVLGILAGELGLNRLKARKHFGLSVDVRGALRKPKSCFIDGLQLATGATYGKGNIRKLGAGKIRVTLRNLGNNQNISISLKKDLSDKLDNLKGHRDSEALARKLYRLSPLEIFDLTPGNPKI